MSISVSHFSWADAADGVVAADIPNVLAKVATSAQTTAKAAPKPVWGRGRSAQPIDDKLFKDLAETSRDGLNALMKSTISFAGSSEDSMDGSSMQGSSSGLKRKSRSSDDVLAAASTSAGGARRQVIAKRKPSAAAAPASFAAISSSTVTTSSSSSATVVRKNVSFARALAGASGSSAAASAAAMMVVEEAMAVVESTVVEEDGEDEDGDEFEYEEAAPGAAAAGGFASPAGHAASSTAEDGFIAVLHTAPKERASRGSKAGARARKAAGVSASAPGSAGGSGPSPKKKSRLDFSSVAASSSAQPGSAGFALTPAMLFGAPKPAAAGPVSAALPAAAAKPFSWGSKKAAAAAAATEAPVAAAQLEAAAASEEAEEVLMATAPAAVTTKEAVAVAVAAPAPVAPWAGAARKDLARALGVTLAEPAAASAAAAADAAPAVRTSFPSLATSAPSAATAAGSGSWATSLFGAPVSAPTPASTPMPVAGAAAASKRASAASGFADSAVKPRVLLTAMAEEDGDADSVDIDEGALDSDVAALMTSGSFSPGGAPSRSAKGPGSVMTSASKAPIEELTEARIETRRKQVALGKSTAGYAAYTATVPREARSASVKEHPQTPDVLARISKRHFDSRVSLWRKALHVWDAPETAAAAAAEAAAAAASSASTKRSANGRSPGAKSTASAGFRAPPSARSSRRVSLMPATVEGTLGSAGPEAAEGTQ